MHIAPLKDLHNAMLGFDDDNVRRLVQDAIISGVDALDVFGVLTKSVAQIGERFEKGEMFLPDLMLAAKTMKAGMSVLQKGIASEDIEKTSYGKIVIGTVFGDIHDIGKNIVATLLKANNFQIIDLGINVKSEEFIAAVKEHNPDILAMSALLTTTAAEQEKVITSLKNMGIRQKIRIMIGGGPITKEFAERIGADGYEPTAPLAVKLARALMNK